MHYMHIHNTICSNFIYPSYCMDARQDSCRCSSCGPAWGCTTALLAALRTSREAAWACKIITYRTR